MTQEQDTQSTGFFETHFSKVDDRMELWAIIGSAMAALMLLSWGIVFLRLGMPSVYVHSALIPVLGTLTLPIIFWGLVKTMFNPPVLRKSRTIGFAALLLVGIGGNIPFVAVPLSTEDFKSAHTYHLPFEGQWYTIAGGDKRRTNYHATTATLRWGYDFTVLEEGEKFSGDGSKVEDYYCYGKPVIAPVSGTVVDFVDYEPDNPPGDVSGPSILGNYIVLEVDREEYLFLAHLRRDSLTVRENEKVQGGQKLAECGNSGRSLEPHLHVHLQNSRNFPFAESLPLYFSNFQVENHNSSEAATLSVPQGMPVGSKNHDSLDGQMVRSK